MSLQGTSTLVTPITGGDLALADNGVFYVALQSTPDVTGIIGPVSTTLDETKALLSVYNSGSVNIYPRFLRLHVHTIGTGGTRVHFTQAIDNINRYSSGGTALAINNTNMNVASGTVAQVYFGAVATATGSSNRRYVANTSFRATAIEVVEEKYQFTWGVANQMEDSGLANNTTTPANATYGFGPICIAPGQSFVLHQWRSSITVGITFGVEFGFVAK